MLAPHRELTGSSKKTPAKEWAHMVDVEKELTNFHELVPNMARKVSIIFKNAQFWTDVYIVAL